MKMKVYYNHTTNAHSILENSQDENDVIVFEGTITECKNYLAPLGVMYLTIKKKSIYLNQKTPLYSTRTHPGCIEFRKRTNRLLFSLEKNKEITKKSLQYFSCKQKWISDSYISIKERVVNNIFSSFKTNLDGYANR